MANKFIPPYERILNRVDGELDENLCWNCSLSNDYEGYSLVSIRDVTYKSHRIMWEVYNGCPIPPDMVIRHKCDNPSCVNPNHLELGTQKDNQGDKKIRGRGPRGRKNTNNKLSVDDVKEIKLLISQGHTDTSSVFKKFNCSPANIWHIRTGRSWGWV